MGKDKELQNKLMEFMNTPGDSVTIPKDIFNEFLTQYLDVNEEFKKMCDIVKNIKTMQTT